MASRKDSKNLSKKDVENIKGIITPRLKYRDTNEELLLKLEDEGYNIGKTKLIEIKSEMRRDLKRNFEERPFELVEEHDLAIQMMKHLLAKYIEDFSGIEDPVDRSRIGAEIRNTQRDLIDYFGSAEIVENVFKYFEEKGDENQKKGIKRVKEELEVDEE